LIARLATAAAKPDGQRVLLDPADIDQHLGSLPVRELPGLGYMGRKKLEDELSIEADMTVAVVRQRVTEESLKRVLGNAYGASLHMMLYGQDNRELETQHVRKSYSAEVNWGVRFDRGDDAKVRKFIQDIADYLSEELQNLGFVASALSIKIKRKKKDAKTPYKMLGHGPCDNFTKSTSFGVATSDAKVIGREAIRLYADLKVPPAELRGAGIMMTKLSFVASEQKTAGRMTKYFQPVALRPGASNEARSVVSLESSERVQTVASAPCIQAEGIGILASQDDGSDYDDNGRPSFSQTLDPETLSQEIDILASQDDGSDYDDNGRPSFSQTLDPETLSQQSSEIRGDRGFYDEGNAVWRNHDDNVLRQDEISPIATGTEHRSLDIDTIPSVVSDSHQVSSLPTRDTDQRPPSSHNVDLGASADGSRRPSIDRNDFIPRLSQVDPEIMAALGPDWASICVAELADNQNQRESAGTMQSATGRQQSVPTGASTRPSFSSSDVTRRTMGPPPATVRTAGADRSSRSSPARQGPSRGPRLNGDRPHKRRKPAQQTLLNMQQNAAKWSQLQQWAQTDHEVGAILQGMSKEEQLAMFEDLRQAKSAAHNELEWQGTSNGRKSAKFRSGRTSSTTPAPSVRTAPEQRRDTEMLAETRHEYEASMSETGLGDRERDHVAAMDCHAILNQPRAEQETSARASSGPREDRTAASVTENRPAAVDLHARTDPPSAAVVSNESAEVCASVETVEDSRMLGREADFEDLHEASARLVVQHEAPCDSMIDVLAIGFWQILEDNQLLAAEVWLRFFRRVVAGSEWRARASLEWVRGYNKLLERCQQLVHRRYGSFLNIAQINIACGRQAAGTATS
jgi:hypothetical protein